MLKYWGKQMFTHGSFPEVGQNQKMEKKERKRERPWVGNNNGQLRVAMPPQVAHAKPPGPKVMVWILSSPFIWVSHLRILQPKVSPPLIRMPRRARTKASSFQLMRYRTLCQCFFAVKHWYQYISNCLKFRYTNVLFPTWCCSSDNFSQTVGIFLLPSKLFFTM